MLILFLLIALVVLLPLTIYLIRQFQERHKLYDFYLAGPMRGIPELNKPLFNEVAGILRKMGFTVFNPSEVNDDDMSFEECMYIDLNAIVNKCKRVAVLRGWRKSVGSNVEVLTAFACGKPVDEIRFHEPEKTVTLVPLNTSKLVLPYRHKLQPSILNDLGVSCLKAK